MFILIVLSFLLCEYTTIISFSPADGQLNFSFMDKAIKSILIVSIYKYLYTLGIGLLGLRICTCSPTVDIAK